MPIYKVSVIVLCVLFLLWIAKKLITSIFSHSSNQKEEIIQSAADEMRRPILANLITIKSWASERRAQVMTDRFSGIVDSQYGSVPLEIRTAAEAISQNVRQFFPQILQDVAMLMALFDVFLSYSKAHDGRQEGVAQQDFQTSLDATTMHIIDVCDKIEKEIISDSQYSAFGG